MRMCDCSSVVFSSDRFTVALFLRAYSVVASTYTGIEAVSNNVNMLAEPRVRTGHWTMFYMALSLAFTAVCVILLYLLWHASPTTGQTLNAVTFRLVLSSLPLGATHVDTDRKSTRLNSSH